MLWLMLHELLNNLKGDEYYFIQLFRFFLFFLVLEVLRQQALLEIPDEDLKGISFSYKLVYLWHLHR